MSQTQHEEIELNKRVLFHGKYETKDPGIYVPTSWSVDGELVVKGNGFISVSMNASMSIMHDSSTFESESANVEINTSGMKIEYNHNYTDSHPDTQNAKVNMHFKYESDVADFIMPENWEWTYLNDEECHLDGYDEEKCNEKLEFLQRFQNNELTVKEVIEIVHDLLDEYLDENIIPKRASNFIYEMLGNIDEVKVEEVD